jgi:hypothetical protein
MCATSKLPKEFFVGGNGSCSCVFTVKVPEQFASEKGCELHYTFKVSQSEPTERWPNPAHFVNLLTGPDNTSDYSYLGMLNPNTGEIRLTAKSCAGATAWSVRIVRRVMGAVFEGDGVESIRRNGWDIDHEGRCGRCGRALTVPESIEVGIGPDCAEILGIPYPVRSKAKKPRKSKKAMAAEIVSSYSEASPGD